jgi:hypothetical protein
MVSVEHDMKTMAMVTGLFVMAAFGTGCAASDPAKAFDGNAQYQAEADQAKAQGIGNRMWATMTSAPEPVRNYV